MMTAYLATEECVLLIELLQNVEYNNTQSICITTKCTGKRYCWFRLDGRKKVHRLIYWTTNLKAGTGNDCAKQNNANGWFMRRSIRKNLLSAGVVGAFAPIGSGKKFFLLFIVFLYFVHIDLKNHYIFCTVPACAIPIYTYIENNVDVFPMRFFSFVKLINFPYCYLNAGVGYACAGQNRANVWLALRSIHDRFMSFDNNAGAFAPTGSKLYNSRCVQAPDFRMRVCIWHDRTKADYNFARNE